MYVYFIQAGVNGPVKIGCADKPHRRLALMQPFNADVLAIRGVCLGGRMGEAALQRSFRDSRIRDTEWYEATADLQDFIAKLPSWDEVRAGAPCPSLQLAEINPYRQLRVQGYTFDEIGSLLGVTRQRAHQLVGPGITANTPAPEEPIEQAYQHLLDSPIPLLQAAE